MNHFHQPSCPPKHFRAFAQTWVVNVDGGATGQHRLSHFEWVRFAEICPMGLLADLFQVGSAIGPNGYRYVRVS